MKAAVINKFGPPEVFEIKEIATPEISSEEVLIKNLASSVNPVDWKHRYGNHKRIKGSAFPIILGYDAAGIIEKKGEDVIGFEIGDEVYTRVNKNYGGAYANFTVTHFNTLSKKPANISFDEAAAVPLAAVTALQGLRDFGKISPGKKVLITGAAGGVGHFAVQIAKYFKAEVTAVCSSRHSELMQKLHVDQHIDYQKTDLEKLNQKFDIIFDSVGTESFISMHHQLNPSGIYITTLPRLKVLFGKLYSVFTRGKKAKTFLMKSRGTDLDFISKMIQEERLTILIDKIFTLDDIAKAHEYSETGRATGKIVIKTSI